MFSFLFTAASLVSLAYGANNWVVPCQNGRCAYDIQGAASGTLTIVNCDSQVRLFDSHDMHLVWLSHCDLRPDGRQWMGNVDL